MESITGLRRSLSEIIKGFSAVTFTCQAGPETLSPYPDRKRVLRASNPSNDHNFPQDVFFHLSATEVSSSVKDQLVQVQQIQASCGFAASRSRRKFDVHTATSTRTRTRTTSAATTAIYYSSRSC